MILNKTWRGIGTALVAAAGVCGASCERASEPAQDGVAKTPALDELLRASPLRVVVTVPALKGLVEPLLPEGSSVAMLMRPGRSEHGYELTAQDIASVAGADVFVYVGLGLETRVERVLEKRGDAGLEGVVCVADALGISLDADGHEDEAHAGHAHEEHDGHTHEEHVHRVDQHVWLDPVLVARSVPELAERIEASLRAKPGWNEDAAGALAARRDALIARVEGVDRAYRERLAPFAGRAIITHHDAFSRVAERYGLKIAAVIRVGDSGESTPEDIVRVVAAVKEHGAGAIFREPQYDAKAATRLAEQAGVRLLTLDPLGDGDWFAMMEANLEALCDGLGGGLGGGGGGK